MKAMLTQANLKVNAIDLAQQCKEHRCSLGTALLTLQGQIEQTAKDITYKEKGCLPPGSWLDAYITIRAETNKTFWHQYRTAA